MRAVVHFVWTVIKFRSLSVWTEVRLEGAVIRFVRAEVGLEGAVIGCSLMGGVRVLGFVGNVSFRPLGTVVCFGFRLSAVVRLIWTVIRFRSWMSAKVRLEWTVFSLGFMLCVVVRF